MKKRFIITVDGGTTNTRAVLWEQAQVVAIAKEEVGVRNTAIDGNNHRLKGATRRCLESLLEQRGIGYSDVESVIASGMITSNVGLVEIPHLIAPAGIEELAQGLRSIMLEDICPLPIWFIPGIKNDCDRVTLENFEVMDIMRGEETESVCLIEHYGKGQPLVLILPGSHMKMVSVDAQGRITGCMTSLSGELLSALTQHTILADAVEKKFADSAHYDQEMAIRGFRTAQAVGFSRACFSARIISQFVDKDPSQIASYLLGVTLGEDILALRRTKSILAPRDVHILIAGKEPIRRAMADLLREDGFFSHIVSYEDAGAPISAQGARLIAAHRRAY